MAIPATAMSLVDHFSNVRSTSRGASSVAFFDLDRTLISGYSLTALAKQQLANGQVSLRRLCNLALMFARYGLHRIDYQQMLQATVDDICGMSEAQLKRLVDQAFTARIAPSIYHESFSLVEQHRRLGHAVVMVTSATQFQAQPVAEVLGIKDIRCTWLEVEDGVITDRVQACYGEGKLVAACDYLAQRALSLDDAYFYSDSDEDLPLLRRVGYPVVVNGKPELVKVALQQNWAMLNFEHLSTEKLPQAA